MARKRRKRNRNRKAESQQAAGVSADQMLALAQSYGLSHQVLGLNEESDDDEDSRPERGKERFCQNSALTMKLDRPKYMHDPCI